jgi:flagellar hook-associated protein 3 FlgL
MRISNSVMASHIKANLAAQSEALMQTQLDLATGKKIHKPSDDPIGMGKVLDCRTTLQSIEQYQENILDAKTRIEYTEEVLGQIDEYIDDARHIASNVDTEDRVVLAQEIEHIREQVLSLSNSKYGSSYIFSGHLSDSEPFNQSSPYDYVGDSGSHQVIIGDGITVEIEADGQEMFVDQDGGGDSLFKILEDLETAIAANPFDDDAVHSALAPLSRIDEQIQLSRSDFAADYKRLERTEAYWKSFEDTVESMRQSIEDTDVTQAAVEMQVQQTAYEVLLKTSAQVIQPTLVDFLG